MMFIVKCYTLNVSIYKSGKKSKNIEIKFHPFSNIRKIKFYIFYTANILYVIFP